MFLGQFLDFLKYVTIHTTNFKFKKPFFKIFQCFNRKKLQDSYLQNPQKIVSLGDKRFLNWISNLTF